MGEQVIVLTDLTKQYGNFTAVDHIRLNIRKGEIFGLLGPNGAGKTTTIGMLSTLLLPTSGEIWINGELLTRQKTHHLRTVFQLHDHIRPFRLQMRARPAHLIRIRTLKLRNMSLHQRRLFRQILQLR